MHTSHGAVRAESGPGMRLLLSTKQHAATKRDGQIVYCVHLDRLSCRAACLRSERAATILDVPFWRQRGEKTLRRGHKTGLVPDFIRRIDGYQTRRETARRKMPSNSCIYRLSRLEANCIHPGWLDLLCCHVEYSTLHTVEYIHLTRDQSRASEMERDDKTEKRWTRNMHSDEVAQITLSKRRLVTLRWYNHHTSNRLVDKNVQRLLQGLSNVIDHKN